MASLLFNFLTWDKPWQRCVTPVRVLLVNMLTRSDQGTHTTATAPKPLSCEQSKRVMLTSMAPALGMLKFKGDIGFKLTGPEVEGWTLQGLPSWRDWIICGGETFQVRLYFAEALCLSVCLQHVFFIHNKWMPFFTAKKYNIVVNLWLLRACHATVSSKFKRFCPSQRDFLKTHEVDQSHKSQRVSENCKINQAILPKVTQSITLLPVKLPETPTGGSGIQLAFQWQSCLWATCASISNPIKNSLICRIGSGKIILVCHQFSA